MTQIEINASQGVRTQLSVEAGEFVPNFHGPQQMAQDGGNLTPQQLNELPKYMTSCYPFVQGDPGPGPRASVPWHGPGRPPVATTTGHGNAGQRMPAPAAPPPTQPGGYSYSGARPSGPPQTYTQRPPPPRAQGYPNRQPHTIPPYPNTPTAPLGVPPPASLVGAPPAGIAPQPQSFPPSPTPPTAAAPLPAPSVPGYQQFYPALGATQGLLSPQAWGPAPPPGFQDYPGQYGAPSYRASGAGGFHGVSEHPEWSGSERSRSSDRSKTSAKIAKKKRYDSGAGGAPTTMVSIGIQNESGVASRSTRNKVKTKTIILMDAAIQTDFLEEIANLTLAERPNSLYKRSKSRMRRKNQARSHDNTSTDSEAVDSDSGYSSPLHRRNQISNGTHTGSSVNNAAKAPSGHQLQGVAYSSAPVDRSRNAPLSYAGIASYGIGGSGDGPSKSSYANNYQETISQTQVAPHDAGEGLDGKKKKRRRSRRKKRKSIGGEDVAALSDEPREHLSRAPSSGNISRTSNDCTSAPDPTGLHFEDEDEFPDLLSSASALHHGIPRQSSSIVSYSEAVKTVPQPGLPLSLQRASSELQSLSPGPTDSKGKETKTARKRRKRREIANKAADDELAEINLEQQVLKEMGMKKSQEQQSTTTTTPGGTASGGATKNGPPGGATAAGGGGKKSKAPIALNIADMISALEKQKEVDEQKALEEKLKLSSGAKERRKPFSSNTESNASRLRVQNPASDASATLVKRGKEREIPKAKKPSPLKKVILKEREERKRQRLLDEDVDDTDPDKVKVAGEGEEEEGEEEKENQDGGGEEDDDEEDEKEEDEPSEAADTKRTGMVTFQGIDDCGLSQDVESKGSSLELGTPASADLSPISQTSPISMSPLSPGGSPLSSGVNSPIAGTLPCGGDASVAMKIHSRRFREYCNQILDKEIDNCCTLLLQDLVRFQDRLYHKNPIKAKSRRRIVLGLREVTKHLKLRKVKCVIISPNLERIQSKGGLDDALNNIIDICRQYDVPFVFALGRRALGRACAKLVPVSVVGIFSYDGANEHFHRLMELTEQARQSYKDMISILEKEIQENPNKTEAGKFPQIFAHMGHSRTPSACSAISFTSSILSEPISENYPQSEPETDSRGYEIIRKKEEREVRQSNVGGGGRPVAATDKPRTGSPDSEKDSLSLNVNNGGNGGGGNKVSIVESIHEIDEGHEADTEDIDSGRPQEKSGDISKELENFIGLSVNDGSEADTVKELPHIDSIHSSTALELSVEILSQHSSKTLDLCSEVMSTHSSKIVEIGSPVNVDLSGLDLDESEEAIREEEEEEEEPKEEEEEKSNVELNQTKVRPMDKGRIEDWVAETQSRMEELKVTESEDDDDDHEEEEEDDDKEEENEESSQELVSHASLSCKMETSSASCDTKPSTDSKPEGASSSSKGNTESNDR